jgi:signal peptidase I
MDWHPIKRFFFPDLSRAFWVRLGVVAGGAYLFFGYVCIPTRNRGSSMEPTYLDGQFNFCWRLRYAFRSPQPGDVVVVRLAGVRVMYLKRVVAVANETVEFRHGRLYVNDRERQEDYLRYPCAWDLEPRTVKPEHVYVVGDNRDMPMERHLFGQTPLSRIVGGLLW